jgi:PAS domain S-box-containing protein
MAIALPKTLRKLIANTPLRGMLVVPFVVQTVGAVTLVGYLSYRSGQEAVTNLGQRLVAETNERVTQELKMYLQTPILINRLNVDAVNQGQINLQSTPALEAALFNRLQQFDQVSAILFASPQGTFRFVERFPTLYGGVADPPRPDQIRIYRLDSQGKPGKLIHISNNLDVRRDSQRDRFTNRPWYKRAVTTGKPGWNPIAQYGDVKTLTLNASQPVYQRDTNRLLGVFSVHLRLDYLSEILHRLDISRFGRVVITDQNGALVATSFKEQPYTINAVTGKPDQFKQLKMDQSRDGLTRSLGEYLRDSRRDGFTNRPDTLALNQPQYLEFRYQNELQNVKITPFQDQYGLNWRVVTVIPTSHFMAAISNNTHTTILLCLLTLGGAIALGLCAANQLIARFKQFNQVSQELAAGNFDQRLPIDSPISELNSLAQTFNQMADQVQQSFERIKTALAESEEKFTIIFRFSPDLITLTTRAEGRCVEANDSFFEVLEYSREQLIGQRLVDLGIWGNLGDRIQFREALQQSGSVRNLEVQSHTRTGHLKTLLVSAELIEISGEPYVLGIGRDISDRAWLEAERKQAEAALRQSEAINQAILNALPDLIIRMHQDGTYLDFKPTNAFPIEFPNLRNGENIRNILPLEAAQQRLSAATAALQTGIIQIYEFPLLVQGQHLWQEARVMPLNADEVLVVIRDLTQRHQFEAALQLSEARYRGIVEDQTELICRFQLDGTLTFVNAAYCRYFELDPETAIGSRYQPVIFEADRDRVAQLVNSMCLENSTVMIENRVVAQGEVRWTQWNNRAVFDEQGHLIEFQSVGRDISDRKNAEAALQESEARFQEIAQTLNQVSYVISLTTGQYLYISPSYERLWGYSCESLYQNPRSWLDRIHPEDSEYILNAFDQLLSGFQTRLQYRIICANGDVRWIQSESLIVCDADGNPLRIVGLADDITAHKQLEESLKLSEARYRAIVEDQVELICRFQPDGTLTFANETFCRYFELDPAGVLGRRYEPLIFEADRERVNHLVGLMSQDTPTMTIENRVFSHGELRWTQWNARAIFEQGQFIEFQSVGRDITDRKQAEAEIQQLNQQLTERVNDLQTLFEVLPIGVAIGEDPECRVARINPCLSDILRVPLDANASPSAPAAERPAYKVYREGQELSVEELPMQYASAHNIAVRDEVVEIVHADGTVIQLLSYASPLLDEQGKVRGSIGGFVDISDRKQTEAALRESEERFRRAFDDAPIGMSLISLTGRFLKVNAYYCSLVGYTEEELLKLNFQDITYLEDLQEDTQGIHRMLVGETRSFQMEKRYVTKLGEIVPVLMSTAPIRDQAGQPLYFVGHIQDIRDRLKIERMKDEFVSVVSHELRTPLTSIRGALGILESGIFNNRPEKAQHMLKIALNNSDRLVRLVNDILDLERLESGKVQLVMEPCQVADLIQQAVDGIQAIADQSHITLAVTFLSATLYAAPDAIIQTLINLLSNAIKFSDPGDTVWLKAELANGEWRMANGKEAEIESQTSKVRSHSELKTPNSLPPSSTQNSKLKTQNSFPPSLLFSITDRGRGIPADKLEFIFEQFQQVDVSDSREKGGTGLGLAICKNIVQQHNGQIWVESTPGKGSTFYFTLPVEQVSGSGFQVSDSAHSSLTPDP